MSDVLLLYLFTRLDAPPMEGEEGWVDPRQKALDRMAENARELGLTYDPADDQLDGPIKRGGE